MNHEELLIEIKKAVAKAVEAGVDSTDIEDAVYEAQDAPHLHNNNENS